MTWNSEFSKMSDIRCEKIERKPNSSAQVIHVGRMKIDKVTFDLAEVMAVYRRQKTESQ